MCIPYITRNQRRNISNLIFLGRGHDITCRTEHFWLFANNKRYVTYPRDVMFVFNGCLRLLLMTYTFYIFVHTLHTTFHSNCVNGACCRIQSKDFALNTLTSLLTRTNNNNPGMCCYDKEFLFTWVSSTSCCVLDVLDVRQ